MREGISSRLRLSCRCRRCRHRKSVRPLGRTFFNLTFLNKISSRFFDTRTLCVPAETDYFHHLSDHLPKDVRNFAAEGGHSLLWPEGTIFLNQRVAYPRPEAATVACGRRTQGFMSLLSQLNPG